MCLGGGRGRKGQRREGGGGRGLEGGNTGKNKIEVTDRKKRKEVSRFCQNEEEEKRETSDGQGERERREKKKGRRSTRTRTQTHTQTHIHTHAHTQPILEKAHHVRVCDADCFYYFKISIVPLIESLYRSDSSFRLYVHIFCFSFPEGKT